MKLTKTRSKIASAVVAGLLLASQFIAPLSASASHLSGGYNATLNSPTPPTATDTYVWKVTGSKPGPGQEISHVTLNGCWTKDSIKYFYASDGNEELKNDGTLKVDNVQDNDLPLTITAVFKNAYASTGNANVFVKTGGGSNAGFTFPTAGPNCQPLPSYGSVKVDKKVDKFGTGTYADGNAMNFSWQLNGAGSQAMGTTVSNVTTGAHSVAENPVNGYEFTGWYFTELEDNFGQHQVNCKYPQGTALPVNITVEKDKTKKLTFCNKVKKGSITIIKDAQPNSHQDFDFNINQDGYGLYDNFELEDDGNNFDGQKNYKTFDNLTAGEYVVTEAGEYDWNLSSITCSEGADVVVNKEQGKVTIDLKNGDSVTCTFVNAKTAKLRIKKDARPYTHQDFTFYSDELGDFQLDDDFNPTLSNQKTFNGLSAGEYGVREDQMWGWKLKDLKCYGTDDYTVYWDEARVQVNLKAGDDVTCVFENHQQNALGGFKFEDANLNGQWDNGEPTLEGWTITLTDEQGVTKSIQTNSDGFYTFTGLDSGTYLVCEEQQDGWVQTYPWTQDGCQEVTLRGPGYFTSCIHFGNARLGSVEGVKFNDVNGNSQRDDSEPTLEGWTIELYELVYGEDESLAWSETPSQTTTTDASGAYSFTNLLPGTYLVCEVQKANWKQTYPTTADGCHEVVIATSGQVVAADFGNKADPQVLGGGTGGGGTLVNTGASVAGSLFVGLTILSALGAIQFLSVRRKDYAKS